MFSTVGKTPEQLEKERMMMMQGKQAQPAVQPDMGPRQPGITEQFTNMAKEKVMGDALTKGTNMAYEKLSLIHI